MNFLDLSGYMFSGKSAVSDLLREVEVVYVPNYRVEFELVRISGGLLDLDYALTLNWSWFRSDRAIREFESIASRFKSQKYPLFKKISPSFSYDDVYTEFSEQTDLFIGKLILDTWNMPLPFELTRISTLRYMGLRIRQALIRKKPWPEVQFRLTNSINFRSLASNYLSSILKPRGLSPQYRTVVTHNMFEPYNPTSGLNLLKDSKCIIIDRDVRDIYVTSRIYSHGLNDDVKTYSKIIGAHNIDSFIRRQRVLREMTRYSADDARVLRVRYEDLVLDYERTVANIFNFLKIDPVHHVQRGAFFNPLVSRNNVYTWKSETGVPSADIRQIERELPSLCYLQ